MLEEWDCQDGGNGADQETGQHQEKGQAEEGHLASSFVFPVAADAWPSCLLCTSPPPSGMPPSRDDSCKVLKD